MSSVPPDSAMIKDLKAEYKAFLWNTSVCVDCMNAYAVR